MPKNGQKGHFGPKIWKLKLMLYDTVGVKMLKLGIHHLDIILKIRMQYENFISDYLGVIGLLCIQYIPKQAQNDPKTALLGQGTPIMLCHLFGILR